MSQSVDWLRPERSYPGAPRFAGLAAIAMVEAQVEHKDHCTRQRRYYISSRSLSAAAFAQAVRQHWAIENNLHWSLDVTFKEDLSRLRKGHGAQNMAVVRHFAINLLRRAKDKKSLKRRRKCAAFDPNYMLKILDFRPVNLDS